MDPDPAGALRIDINNTINNQQPSTKPPPPHASTAIHHSFTTN